MPLIAIHSFKPLFLFRQSFVYRMLINTFHLLPVMLSQVTHPFRVCSFMSLVKSKALFQATCLFTVCSCLLLSPKMLIQAIHSFTLRSTTPLVFQNGHSGHLLAYSMCGHTSLWHPNYSFVTRLYYACSHVSLAAKMIVEATLLLSVCSFVSHVDFRCAFLCLCSLSISTVIG